MTLNQDVRFQDSEPDVKRAFLHAPEKIHLRQGHQLYKWTERPLIGRDGRITAWWSFVESTRLPSGMTAEGFRVSEERAARLGRSHRDYAKVRAAISGEFRNSMTDLLVVRLNEPVWGFADQASGQPEFAKKHVDLQHVFLIGGAWQVWIPNLEAGHLSALPVRG
jgi:hypothetical protein